MMHYIEQIITWSLHLGILKVWGLGVPQITISYRNLTLGVMVINKKVIFPLLLVLTLACILLVTVRIEHFNQTLVLKSDTDSAELNNELLELDIVIVRFPFEISYISRRDVKMNGYSWNIVSHTYSNGVYTMSIRCPQGKTYKFSFHNKFGETRFTLESFDSYYKLTPID
jgi:hypothetical protein